MCLSGMLSLHATFGCQLSEHNVVDACLCDHPDFRYGINDCSIQACSADENHQLVGWVEETCSATGGQATAASEATRTAARDFASSGIAADPSSLVIRTRATYEKSTQVSSAVAEATDTAHDEQENWVGLPAARGCC
jgi:hypothetical protein